MRDRTRNQVVFLCATALLALPLAAGMNPALITGGSHCELLPDRDSTPSLAIPEQTDPVLLLARGGNGNGNGGGGGNGNGNGSGHGGGRGGQGGYGPGDGTGTADDRPLDGTGKGPGIFCTRT